MNGARTNRTKAWGSLLLAAAGFAGLATSDPARQVFTSANQAVGYYRALERAEVKAGFFERVALSLVLASADSARRECAKKAPAPTSSS